MHYVEETNQPAIFLLYCVHDATLTVNLTLLLEIMHCMHNLQIIP